MDVSGQYVSSPNHNLTLTSIFKPLLICFVGGIRQTSPLLALIQQWFAGFRILNKLILNMPYSMECVLLAIAVKCRHYWNLLNGDILYLTTMTVRVCRLYLNPKPPLLACFVGDSSQMSPLLTSTQWWFAGFRILKSAIQYEACFVGGSRQMSPLLALTQGHFARFGIHSCVIYGTLKNMNKIVPGIPDRNSEFHILPVAARY